MSGWDGLVTAALLGADRRASPEGLPPEVAVLASGEQDAGLALLDRAAGCVTQLRAGRRPTGCPPPPVAPRQRLDLAPAPAHTLLDALLASRDKAGVEEWLRVCATRGLGVRAGLWCRLAVAATAPRGVDRALVRAALGERGLAFVAMHPRWGVLASGPDRPRSSRRRPETGGPRAAVSPVCTARGLAAVGGAPLAIDLAGLHLDAELSAALAQAPEPPEPSARPAVLRQVEQQSKRRAGRSAGPESGPDGEWQLLRRVVAHTDLSAWEQHTGLDPRRFLAALPASPGRRAVLHGVGDAALIQRRPEWVAALVAGADPGDPCPADLLSRLPAPWPEPVGEAVLGSLEAGSLPRAAARRLALMVAHRAPLSVQEHVERLAAHERATGRPPGLLEAGRALATRVRIDRSFCTETDQEHR